ncbi:MAG: NAD(P)-binding domain-containing protein [Chloroflexi bacterium]|jgi:pyrroline-5-carboxylate reductase|nr:NAD(P)-binding domain-containing protein [Chloroflexota bacterium]MBT7082285.1 NAD(P)-binding domain-containing protein [Chloroflexota bacterium]MBT7289731.1 NAD(P)-binding domain-containing protein [Chloroflexota bacterium]
MEAKVGFIGFGSMGSVLLRSLLRYGALVQEEVILCTRSRDKLSGFASSNPGMELVRSNVELAEKSRTIFICVRIEDVKGIIEEMKPQLSQDKHIVIISAGLSMENVSKIFDGQLTRVIPSLVCGTKNCVTLIHHNDKVTEDESARVEMWFSKIGNFKILDEDQFEVGANLTSCAPAFMAAMMKYFIAEAVKHSSFTPEEAEEMVRKTMLGTATLITKRKLSFDTIVQRVATEGGITEAGVKVLDEKLPEVFSELFLATEHRHKAVSDDMGELWSA